MGSWIIRTPCCHPRNPGNTWVCTQCVGATNNRMELEATVVEITVALQAGSPSCKLPL